MSKSPQRMEEWGRERLPGREVRRAQSLVVLRAPRIRPKRVRRIGLRREHQSGTHLSHLDPPEARPPIPARRSHHSNPKTDRAVQLYFSF